MVSKNIEKWKTHRPVNKTLFNSLKKHDDVEQRELNEIAND